MYKKKGEKDRDKVRGLLADLLSRPLKLSGFAAIDSTLELRSKAVQCSLLRPRLTKKTRVISSHQHHHHAGLVEAAAA